MDKKILAIDDELFIRELVQDFLELENYHCETASNLEQAVQLIESGEHTFALILLDRNLEDKSPEEVIIELRAVQSETPIVIMTGDLDIPDDFLSKYNISAVINKPFQYDEFINTVKQSL